MSLTMLAATRPYLVVPLLAVALGIAPPTWAADPPLDESARREIERALLRLEQQWIEVYSSHDLSVLERLIADDFVATLADGGMRGKREHIVAYAADFATWAAVANSELRAHVYTPEVAVVTGLYTARLREPKGSETTERYRYTDTWVLRAGSWQCVATQETRVPSGTASE